MMSNNHHRVSDVGSHECLAVIGGRSRQPSTRHAPFSLNGRHVFFPVIVKSFARQDDFPSSDLDNAI